MAETCGNLDVGCKLKEAGADAMADGLDRIASAVAEGLEKMVVGATSFWVTNPAPVIEADSGVTGFIDSYLTPFTLLFATCSVIIGAIKMMIDRHGQAVRELALGLVQLALISGMAVAAIGILAQVSAQFSRGIIDASLQGGDMGENLATLMVLEPLGAVLGVILGIFGIIAAFFQYLLMLVRDWALPILAGVLTLSAAFWTTDTGKAWLSRFIVITVGILAYQPAASIVYASAFLRMGESTIAGARNQGEYLLALADTTAGIGTLFLAIIMLPAMIGFAIPIAGKLAGAGAGIAAVGAVGGIVAAGAINNGSTSQTAPAHTTTAGPTGASNDGRSGGTGPSGANGGSGHSGGPGGTGAGGAAATAATGAATGGATVAAKGVEYGAQAAQHGKQAAEGALGEGDQR